MGNLHEDVFKIQSKSKLRELKFPLVFFMTMLKEVYLMKRSQALPGSNLTRDNQMQIALNSAIEEGSAFQPISPHLIYQKKASFFYYSSFFAHALTGTTKHESC